ncbi:hypothetical protein Q5P01_007054 [Channa striata]|uniref:Uncharacterized protein n=1 Tax=Channa striata TaxID=64152 RepID=A0AA88N5T2_CHASR|nr:hypothetical protein Q5P01_007054 [Channa striata]
MRLPLRVYTADILLSEIIYEMGLQRGTEMQQMKTGQCATRSVNISTLVPGRGARTKTLANVHGKSATDSDTNICSCGSGVKH